MPKTKETYWSNGQLKSRINYNDNGQRHGPYERWYENGQQGVKSNFVNGQWHGPCERWYENGQQREKSNHVNGQLNGSYERWYEDGQQREKSNYVNGQNHGPYERWYTNGEQWEKSNYVNGTKGQPTSHAFEVGHLVSYVHNNKENIDCIVQKIEQCGYVMSSGHFVVEQNIKGVDK
ncbi:MAG: hypothetical protein KJ587_19865 [Alphaproteobacteria bacterium]|nr:hypothetical protein [Alphaproteobacteria bacterium]